MGRACTVTAKSILPFMCPLEAGGVLQGDDVRSSGGMAVLVGTYGAADGAADERTPPGLGGWLMVGCWGAGGCFCVFCSQGVAAGGPRYRSSPSPCQLPHTSSAGPRYGMVL